MDVDKEAKIHLPTEDHNQDTMASNAATDSAASCVKTTMQMPEGTTAASRNTGSGEAEPIPELSATTDSTTDSLHVTMEMHVAASRERRSVEAEVGPDKSSPPVEETTTAAAAGVSMIGNCGQLPHMGALLKKGEGISSASKTDRNLHCEIRIKECANGDAGTEEACLANVAVSASDGETCEARMEVGRAMESRCTRAGVDGPMEPTDDAVEAADREMEAEVEFKQTDEIVAEGLNNLQKSKGEVRDTVGFAHSVEANVDAIGAAAHSMAVIEMETAMRPKAGNTHVGVTTELSPRSPPKTDLGNAMDAIGAAAYIKADSGVEAAMQPKAGNTDVCVAAELSLPKTVLEMAMDAQGAISTIMVGSGVETQVQPTAQNVDHFVAPVSRNASESPGIMHVATENTDNCVAGASSSNQRGVTCKPAAAEEKAVGAMRVTAGKAKGKEKTRGSARGGKTVTKLNMTRQNINRKTRKSRSKSLPTVSIVGGAKNRSQSGTKGVRSQSLVAATQRATRVAKQMGTGRSALRATRGSSARGKPGTKKKNAPGNNMGKLKRQAKEANKTPAEAQSRTPNAQEVAPPISSSAWEKMGVEGGMGSSGSASAPREVTPATGATWLRADKKVPKPMSIKRPLGKRKSCFPRAKATTDKAKASRMAQAKARRMAKVKVRRMAKAKADREKARAKAKAKAKAKANKAKAKAKARGVMVALKKGSKTFNIVRQMEVAIIPFMAKAFFAFLRNRERIRLNREAGATGSDAYEGVEGVGVFTADVTCRKLKTRRFTNVYRRNDRTSKEFALLLAQYVDEYREANPEVSENQVLVYAVFTLGVWRSFGTALFAKEVGFIAKWDDEQKDAIRNLVKKYMEYEDLPKLCTAAYKPGNIIRAALLRDPPYWKDFDVTLNSRLEDLWQYVVDVPEVARRTASWEQVAIIIGKARYYGEGIGKNRLPSFHAKELAQDILDTRIFGGRDNVLDLNTWCAVGPGAKRGLNWVTGRIKPASDIANLSQKQAVFEMKTLYSLCVDRFYYHWNGVETRVGGRPPPPLELHDIQFGLCEFDKFMRAQNTNPYVRDDINRNNVKFFKYDAEKCAKSWMYDVSDFEEEARKRKEERVVLFEAEVNKQSKFCENLLQKREHLKNECIRKGRSVPEARVVPFFNEAEAKASLLTARAPKKKSAKAKGKAKAKAKSKVKLKIAQSNLPAPRTARLAKAAPGLQSTRARLAKMTPSQCRNAWRKELFLASTSAPTSSSSSSKAPLPKAESVKEEKVRVKEEPGVPKAENVKEEKVKVKEERGVPKAARVKEEKMELQEDRVEMGNTTPRSAKDEGEAAASGSAEQDIPADKQHCVAGTREEPEEWSSTGGNWRDWTKDGNWSEMDGDAWKTGESWKKNDGGDWNARWGTDDWKKGNWPDRDDDSRSDWKQSDPKRARHDELPSLGGPSMQECPPASPTNSLRWLDRDSCPDLNHDERSHINHWVPQKEDQNYLASSWRGTIPPQVLRTGPNQLLIRGLLFHRRANTVYTYRPDRQARGKPTWWSIDNQFVLCYTRENESIMTLLLEKDVSSAMQLKNAKKFELMYWDDETHEFVENFFSDRSITGCYVDKIKDKRNNEMEGHYVFAPELYNHPTSNAPGLDVAPWWNLSQKSFVYLQRKGQFAIAKHEHYQMVVNGEDVGLVAQDWQESKLCWMECVKDPYNRDEWIKSSVVCQFIDGKESPYTEAMKNCCTVHTDAWMLIEERRLQLKRMRTEQLNRLNRKRRSCPNSGQPSESQPSCPQDTGRQRSGRELSICPQRPIRPRSDPPHFDRQLFDRHRSA
eukprot:GEMP01000679.1.p1 GENE.GEMP01000679.1~~GEMP01000679.1.p1  ORF type:complete len:1805 (+),score=395.20 GEMP01000679.1:94-5508(+)